MPGNGRADVLAAIKNPLGFFSLTMLVIEGIFGLVVGTSKMSGDQQFYSLLVMVAFAVLVVGTVAYITIKWPEHLYEKVADELNRARFVAEFIQSPGLRDVISEEVARQVKPEALSD